MREQMQRLQDEIAAWRYRSKVMPITEKLFTEDEVEEKA